ncbi:E3 ubiquitin-protein ligase HRD1 [Choanephora cucurbitarum]|uniref:RING-type E3 ubiquitin transferase n=1 Tax=Choanephora cucurbitarum TaxID=101091 RepID=A0A1C7N7X7_9FUNG|nr:E3 ubiquitin-protein ligase HRD1 [Choanephora cucurbitarum]
MRLAVFGGVSSILATGVILSAMYQRSNFYAACIYLYKSSACMMILLNMGLILSVLFGKLLQAIFFGRLRAIEVEHLYERAWYAVTETCLAMTIFREEFDLQFIVIFTTLLFLKIFHWLCQDRVEFMEQTPTNRLAFHVRIANLLTLLLIIDVLLATNAIQVTIVKGPTMMIMFGFEYTILICCIVSTIGKYILNIIDMQSEQTWEGKSMYVFYLDLMTDFFKLITYVLFFLYICLNYQFPIHIIRDVYMTFRSFIQKCKDLYRYRRATRNMNELYPDATSEDFSRSNDTTCIICREEMQPTDPPSLEEEEQLNPEVAAHREQNLDQPKKLPCGHIFHFHCLRSWLERQQTCPTCRRSVLVDNNDQQQQQQQQQPHQPQQQQPQQQQPSPFFQQPQQPNQQHTQSTLQEQQPETNPTLPLFNTSNPPAFSVLTPSNQPSPLPGLIPLVPMHQPIVNTELSEEDLRILSSTTREAIEQRFRILETAQHQIFQTMQMLTQVMSVMPNEQQDVQPEPEMSDRKKGKMPEREFAVQESSVDNNHTTGSSSNDNSDNNSKHVERE